MAARSSQARPYRARIVVIAAALIAGAFVLSLAAPPAGAIIVKVGNQGYGVTPIRGVEPASIPGAYRAPEASGLSAAGSARNQDGLPFGGSALASQGGPVMHSTTTHVIYWDPSKEFKATTKGIIGGFFTNVAHDSGLASNVFAIAGQYTDTTGHAAYSSTFGGALVDEEAYPTSGNCTVPTGVDEGPYAKCLFDAQLKAELSNYIGVHSLPTGPTQLYFLLLPHSIATCLPEVVEGKQVCSNNFFCAYHSYISPGTASEIIYADIPFSLLDTGFVKGCQDDGNANLQQPNPDNELGENAETRFADVALKYISHEAIEAITDPLVNNQTAWVDARGLEIGDKCNGVSPDFEHDGIGYDKNAFLPTLGGSAGGSNLFNQSINTGSYYLQSEWDNGAKACTMNPLALSAAGFTTSSTSTHVQFEGKATDPYGGLGFTWKFGDGTESAGATPTHIYSTPGKYTVTMTPKDTLTGSTAAPVSHEILVNDAATAAFTTSANPATAGTSVRFDGSASSDADGSIAEYAWSFGDGGVGAGATPSHTYGAAGNYTVTLTVKDSGGETGSASHQITVAPPVVTPAQPKVPSETTTTTTTATATTAALVTLPSSSFGSLLTTITPTTGAITFSESVSDPGTFSWLLTFQNGKFGAFASGSPKCKAGFIKLSGKCRPAKIMFAKGSKTVTAAGTVIFTLKPSAAALKALKNALKQGKGLPVTATLRFQSALGGSPVSHTQSLMVKLKKK
jgi:PKD repeat protein